MGKVEEAFGKAFEDYSDELFRHCALRLRDRERALEITQECFLRVLEYAQSGNNIHNVRPFLYRTLRHLIIDEYRRHKTSSLEQMAQDAEGSVEDYLPQDESNMLERALERYEGERALEMLQELSEPYREALTLRYVNSLSIKEIAEVVGESENAVSVRIHRGLKKLRAMFESFDDVQDKKNHEKY